MPLHQKHSTFSCLLAGLGDFFMSVPLHETLFHRAKCAKLDYFKVPYSRFFTALSPYWNKFRECLKGTASQHPYSRFVQLIPPTVQT